MHLNLNRHSGLKKKKGLSPVIASVLLVLLVLILAVMIFLWARGFFNEQVEKFGRPIDDSCSSVSFRVERVGSSLEIVNTGDVDIHYFDIKQTLAGNSEMSGFSSQVDIGDSEMEQVYLKMKDGAEPDEIIIYPVLIGNVKGKDSNKVFTCLNEGVVIQ